MALVALALGGGYALLGVLRGGSNPAVAAPAALSSPAPSPSTASAGDPAPAAPKPSVSPSPRATAIVQRGAGTYGYASGGTDVVGHGRLFRYRVAVENGIGVSPATFAAQVDAILDNTQRGWSAGGQFSFQRVPSGPVAFTVFLVSPQTAITKCWNLIHLHVNEYGGVNCSNNGDTVVMNMNRWINLTGYYTGQTDLYHALAINHEVGHSLGHGHVSCPGPGRPAPVMMQQIKGLHGCVPNGWPYTPSGAYLTGPPTR
ncbi:DUF3152 domain-containing protein [Streptacidiphilus rugosus]|uniref:DUF3152 domain-containing protein n=1 Tax=Streptacidiphilus rugosus TaxID=405783 RepID=UPI00068B84C4|nr:DUF3152 domain-containing protein [Streptacidiphilus rugosus]